MKIEKRLWNVKDSTREYIEEEKKTYKLKHGMLASIPLICKGNKCPFISTCRGIESMDVGGRCVVEISAILSRFESLCSHFDIDVSNETLEAKDVVDVSLVKDIVDFEVQILRAENLIASSGNFMADHIAQVDKFGEAYYEEIIHPSLEYKLKLIEQRNKIYTKLNATRKDKSALLKGQDSYTEKALELIEKVKKKVGNIDLEEV